MEGKQDGNSEMGRQGALAINNLTYSFPIDASVATKHSSQTNFFAQTAYSPSDTMVSTWNTGSSYVDLQNSALILDVKNLSALTLTPFTGKAAWWGLFGGSAANLINRLTIFSRSGQVIERLDRANILASIQVQHFHSDGWRKYGPGSNMGCAETIGEQDWAYNAILRFVIPLSVISPFCASVNALCPPQLASGLRFEIVLESAANALLTADATNPTVDTLSYAITASRFVLETYSLADSVVRTLNTAASTNGLELYGLTAHNSIANRSTKILNFDMGKSASRCMYSIFKERYTDTGRLSNASHFQSVLYDTNDYPSEVQFRTGALYYPVSSIRGDTARQTGPEILSLTQHGTGKFFQVDAASSGVSESMFRLGNAVIICDLERSNVTELSGIPLSNSRVLSLNMSFGGATAVNTQIDWYLMYVVLVRVFASNVVIEI